MLPFDHQDPKTLHLKKNPDLWKQVAMDLCARHGVNVTSWFPFSAGSSLVAAVSDSAVVKIIQPPYIDEYEAELWALKHMPQVHVDIPALIASGVDESGWSYLIMTRVPGTQMDLAWPEINHMNRMEILKDIGRLMSTVHSRSRFTDRDYLLKWNAFIQRQKENCLERHSGLGMPKWFIEGIPNYLKNVEFDDSFAPVLLTGEYTPFNLLVVKDGDQWRLSGMVDFADAFAGLSTYDLIGPGVFLCEGDPQLIKSLFDGYGIRLDENLARKLVALQLLHRFSNFKSQVKIPGWLDKVGSFSELEKLLWPLYSN